MEIVLLILAGVVVYYLYITLQEYLKNPIAVESKKNIKPVVEEYDLSKDPYVQISPLDKLKKTEFGLMTMIISKINVDKKTSLQNTLIEGLFEDMQVQMQGVENAKESLFEIYKQQDDSDLEGLCKGLLQATYGEYKKRLKFIEFLFGFAYGDGKLESEEKENIIDIAAFLELSNEDFNKIYDDFEAQNAKEIKISYDEALGLFDLQGEFKEEDLDLKFKNLIIECKQNIFDVKNLNKSFVLCFEKMREIDFAYQILLGAKKEQ
ncbi:TerB family tellurite resistance protein [Helicobacter sp. 13S00477-4]|uniref:TerB family tellurite resistance protein n=1 Tax=Helicobacter sp. 13S00477-4 TaxID=1905759 RepID=UPI000BA70EB5|nr:TerB family tellurite resistance protein [Helicobacter sp. 13S00477-4]PAF50809.1 hypothetical protein BKH44_06555 [Helicobacter sp. 13S00477-4]